ncbi:MAG: DUF2868 domain-containing protein [Gammaproteobacteria bacterium]
MVSEAIRAHEEHAGLLPDEQANLIARRSATALSERIQTRAWLLARDHGERDLLARWQYGARFAGAGMGFLAIVTGVGFAFAALGDGHRPVNLAWALVCLLGLHSVSFLLWVLTLTITAGESGHTLGRLWLAASDRVGGGAGDRLSASLFALLQAKRAGRWLFGFVVHAWWLIALISATVMVLTLLLLRRYGFVWETTLLTSETFVAMTRALGAVPALLGFTMPDEATIRATGEVASTLAERHAWAGWLLGVVVVYGVLPRLLLALYCWQRWTLAKSALTLDLDQPGYAVLRERLAPGSERLGIYDPETSRSTLSTAPTRRLAGIGALIVGIEIDPADAWSPPLPDGVGNAGVLDNRDQRQRLRAQLARQPVLRLLIVCDSRRSPDRGTVALIRDLAAGATDTRIWLLTARECGEARHRKDWESALCGMNFAQTANPPLNWLATGQAS